MDKIKVSIKSRDHRGFYRFGRKFRPDPQVVELTADEYARAIKESELIVSLVDDDDPDADDKTPPLPPVYPAGDPTDKWKAAELRAYLAEKLGVEPDDSMTKAQVLEQIAQLS